MKRTVILIAFLFFGLTAVNAQTVTPKVDKRQEMQRKRIREGVQSGELTRSERHRLVREQRHIRREERRAKADGKVTIRERARLDREQDRVNRDIYRKKNNMRGRN